MSDRKQQVQDQILKFVRSPKTKRKDLLTFGVEFEYQYGEQDDPYCECIENLDYEYRFDVEGIYDAVNTLVEEAWDDIDKIIPAIDIHCISDKDFLFKITGLRDVKHLKSYEVYSSKSSKYKKTVNCLKFHTLTNKLKRFIFFGI